MTNEQEIQRVWETLRRQMTPAQQARVKRRVCEGWSLRKAVENEGIIFVRTNADLEEAKKMFEEGVFEVETRQVETETVQIGVDPAVPGSDETVGVVQNEQGAVQSFVPRPKNKKV